MSFTNVLAIGNTKKDKNNNWLDFYFLKPIVNLEESILDKITSIIPKTNKPVKLTRNDRWINELKVIFESNKIFDGWTKKIDQLLENENKRIPIILLLTKDKKLENVSEAYLKLHLISYRQVKPNTIDLTNLFSILPNIVWTNKGPISINEINEEIWQAKKNDQYINIKSIDKFPPLVDYLVPSNVRIANTANVRLGAYLGSGTTIMHAGFINFNAGTEGPNMIEGRISAGVWVKKNADLGGGCSTMGRLSGGGNVLVSVGENSLIGANAGLGIPLGNNCIIESGLYITAGSKITQIDEHKQSKIVSARELSFKDDLLFRRNSISGSIETIPNKHKPQLDIKLHIND